MKTVTATTRFVTAGSGTAQADLTAQRISTYRLFAEPDEAAGRCLTLLGQALARRGGLAVLGAGPLASELFRAWPELARSACLVLPPGASPTTPLSAPTLGLDEYLAAPGQRRVFLCESSWPRRAALKALLPDGFEILEPDSPDLLDPRRLPRRAFIPESSTPYPMDFPPIAFGPGADMILLDCPGRNLGMMPNGLAYVHAALAGADVRISTLDLDIIVYHRFHAHRLLDLGGNVTLPDGRSAPEDPWAAEHSGWWLDQDFVDFFRPDLEETLEALVRAAPRVLGVSVHECNTLFTRELVRRFRLRCPDTVILAGGYSCNQAQVGFAAFPECDYMCIGEADLTAAPLVKALLAGERPADLPGVLSRTDSPFRVFVPAPIPMDLDALPRPSYPWAKALSLYTNHDNYRLTPVIASRGCRWSRCRFCGECIPWRARDPVLFVDEMQELYEAGRDLYMFNESDFNGSHTHVRAICEEIVRRGLLVRLTGQLRIDRKSTPDFFALLKRAGFVSVRFGVDAWSANTLRIQNKGYTVDVISRNLRDCHQAGIHTEVNAVIGVPGETEEDIDETLALIIANRENIDRMANINPLMLVVGSTFWREPERHGIRFRQDRETLRRENPRAVPAHLWYSENPYMDQHVRTARYRRVVEGLARAGFPLTGFAMKILEDVSLGRDKARAGESEAAGGDSLEAAAPQAADAAAGPVACGDSGAKDAIAPETSSVAAGEPPAAANNPTRHALPPGDDSPLCLLAGRVWAVKGEAHHLPATRAKLADIPRSGLPGLWDSLASHFRAPRPEDPAMARWLTAEGETPRLTLPPEEPVLVREGVRGYNILEIRGSFFALRQGQALDYHAAVNRLYPAHHCLRAQSMHALALAIEEAFKHVGLPERLVKAGVGRYNIVEAGGVYYALLQGRAFNSYKADTGGYAPKECIASGSLSELEGLLLEAGVHPSAG